MLLSRPRATTGARVVTESAVVDVIMSAAAQQGDAAPTAIHYIRGIRGALVDAIDGPNTIDPPNPDTPVVSVTATGNFTRNHLGRFDKTFTGTYIYEVINEQTGEVLDNGISQKPFDSREPAAASRTPRRP